MRYSEIKSELTAWFPPECHKDRDLPGGGTWWYVPWQLIRDRLNEVCPDDWSVRYDKPEFIGNLCYVHCYLTICGIERVGVGSTPIEQISNSGKKMDRGNAIERAIADGFKNACESFGICAYLDEQSDKQTKANFARYMQQAGYGKPAAEYHRQEGTLPASRPTAQPARPFGKPAPSRPAAAPPPAASRPELNGNRLNKLKAWTGHSRTQIIGICNTLNVPHLAAQMNAAQVLQIRDQMFADWGVAQNKFNHLTHAVNSLKKLLAEFEDPDPADEIVWQAWQAKVAEKPPVAAAV